METIKIISDNRITLPKEFVESNKLKDGDLLGVDKIAENRIALFPVEIKMKKP